MAIYKVRELIEALHNFDPKSEVVAFYWNAGDIVDIAGIDDEQADRIWEETAENLNDVIESRLEEIEFNWQMYMNDYLDDYE